MSGHSKWNNIKQTKGKMDALRGKLFTKYGKIISVAVKLGGADPNSNPKLRDAIAKAKANNMPNDNITRCIKKASGEASGGNYEDITYEGYGIGGSAVIVNCLTDNKNRTAGDVRHAFDKHGGALGNTNCVSFMFDRLGQIVIDKNCGHSEDEILEWGLEAGADDVITDDDVYTVVTSSANFNEVRDYLQNKGLTFLSADVSLVPQSYVDLDDDKYAVFQKMLDELEDNDDVQDVYHNVNLKD
ncbi:MAG: YebC/PmpR family DNA-binding transcriptional regulator [Christensenellales bacterium]